ncbi:hypothetical protein LUZ60_006646 [Juncus effusus]|nr:hypothetical protein LUZ60_006646 [Juncus effusus]
MHNLAPLPIPSQSHFHTTNPNKSSLTIIFTCNKQIMETTSKSNSVSPPPPSLPLSGRVAILTGGAGGIGSAISARLASLGAKVVIGYIGDPSPAENLVKTINSESSSTPRAISVHADVSKASDVKALFDVAVSTFGPDLHILVTTAAVLDFDYPKLSETTEETYDKMFNTNTKGTFLCCREGANRLVQDGKGRIVTFSSSGVGSLWPGYAAYAASKGAIEIFTKIMAKELRGTGITANVDTPGPTATPMFYNGKTDEVIEDCVAEIPLGRGGLPADIASLVGFLVSDAGGWVNAQVIRCNGRNIWPNQLISMYSLISLDLSIFFVGLVVYSGEF